MFQRGRPRCCCQPGTYFFKAQPKFSRSLSLAQVAHPTGLPCTGKPDLNSRNCLIITTRLHIVNHSNAHRRKSRFQRFNSESAVSAKSATIYEPARKQLGCKIGTRSKL
jgi:hypothetical protein